MITSQKTRWTFLNTFLARSTGFSFSLIKQFRFKNTWSAMETCWEVVQDAQNLALEIRDEIHALVAAPESLPFRHRLDKIRSKVHRQRPVPAEQAIPEYEKLHRLVDRWNALLDAQEKRKQEAAGIFEAELLEMRARLRDISENHAAFKEAMFLSAPETSEIAIRSYTNSSLAVRNMKTRGRERFFMSYLQRLCTKNDTNAFFGPINFGRFSPGSPNLDFQSGWGKDGKKIARMEVFFSHWACYELAEALGKDPDIFPYIVPHFYPFYLFSGDHLMYFGIEEKAVTSKQMKILKLIDGQRSFEEIRARLAPLTEEDFRQECQALRNEGIITGTVLISPYSENGVKDLLDFLARVPACSAQSHWKYRLEKLESLRVQFRDTPFPERAHFLDEAEQLFENLTGRKARRGEGSFYKDRSIFFEDSLGVVSRLQVGGDLFRNLERSLDGIMTALGIIAAAKWELWQYAGRQVLLRFGGESMSMPLVEFWNEFEYVYEEVQTTEGYLQRKEALAEAERCFEKAVGDDHCVNEAFLLPEINRILKAAHLLRDRQYPLCASPDLFVAGKSVKDVGEGNYLLCLGEMHNHLFTMLYGTTTYFCPWREEYVAGVGDILQRLSRPHHPLQLVVRREMKLFPAKVKGHLLCLQEPHWDGKQETTVSMHDLNVKEINGEILLQHKNSGGTFVFPGHIIRDPDYDFLQIFSFPYVDYVPASTKKFRPRINWNGILYQRKGWHLTDEDLKEFLNASGFDLFWAIFKYIKTANITKCVFARHPLEMKPFFVDFENFFLIEMLQHILHAKPDVRLSEFCPGEEELWFDIEGEPYCCEFRTGMYVAGDTEK